jgi:peptide-methionine (R)-S-oxide reductase
MRFFPNDSLIKSLMLSDDEWKKRLTPLQYNILRKEGTEPPHSSPLNNEKRDGIFACTACELALFDSSTKYDSGTGWPSFFDFIPEHIKTKRDFRTIWPRTEYHCARCGGHHGHIFKDGPEPTGLRYCNKIPSRFSLFRGLLWGGSVPSLRRILYCRGVKRFFHSSSLNMSDFISESLAMTFFPIINPIVDIVVIIKKFLLFILSSMHGIFLAFS